MLAMDNPALDFLRERRSTPSRTLAAPGPDAAQLDTLLRVATRVPDHGRLVPWRLLRIEGDARLRLGDHLARICLAERPDAPQAVLDKERTRFAFAPLVLAVIARITPGHKIPEVEQRLSGGALCFQLLLSAQALGFGAQWLTGWAAYHPEVQRLLGLVDGEEILGFVHIGTATSPAADRDRPDPTSLLSTWPG